MGSEVAENEGPEQNLRTSLRVVKIKESWGRWRFWGNPAVGMEPDFGEPEENVGWRLWTGKDGGKMDIGRGGLESD